jgi:hypothetical protein
MMALRVRTHVRTGQAAPGIAGGGGGGANVFTYNFLSSPSVPAQFSFSRASGNATSFNSSGVLITSATNVARFQNTWNGSVWSAAGLLIEEARTNYMGNPDMSATGPWATSNLSVGGAATSIDGTSDAYTLINAGLGYHIIYQTSNVGTAPGSMVFSGYVKSTTGYTKCAIRPINSAQMFNLSAKTAMTPYVNAGDNISFSAAGVIDVGGGWYFVSMVMSPTSGSITSPNHMWMVLDDSYASGDPTAYSYAGDGTTVRQTLFGLDAQAGSFSTSHIPIVAGTSTTRAADSLTSAGTLTTQLAAGPSVWELTDLATGTTSRVQAAAGAFTFPVNKLYRSMAVYPSGTDTSSFLTVGGAY